MRLGRYRIYSIKNVELIYAIVNKIHTLSI